MKTFIFLLFPIFAYSQSVDSLDFKEINGELVAFFWVNQADVLQWDGGLFLPLSAIKPNLSSGCMCMAKAPLDKSEIQATCLFNSKSFSPADASAQKAIASNADAYFFAILADDPLLFLWHW